MGSIGEASRSLPARLAFGELRKAVEICLPHGGQDGLQRPQPLTVSAVEARRPGVAAPDQLGIFQHPEVLGDRRPTDVETGCDLAGSELLVPDKAQYLPSTRACNCPDRSFVHDDHSTGCLRLALN